MSFALKGRFFWDVMRTDGSVRDVGEFRNAITLTSIDNLFDTYFLNGTPATAWYLGLIDDSGYTAVDTADTMSSHAGWTEVTDYAAATRPAWAPDVAASQIISNSTKVAYVINASGIVLRGGFVTSNNTKGGTTGTLWSTGIFSVAQTVNNGETFRLTYRLEGREG